MWVATASVIMMRIWKSLISTHATHVGGDEETPPEVKQGKPFQLTPPMWVATLRFNAKSAGKVISTHATHVGGDILYILMIMGAKYFNSRHPCGWRL